MDTLITDLQKLCQRRHKSEEDIKKFQDFVEELTIEQIETLVSERLSYIEGPQIINAIFLGLTQKNPSQKKRVKLFELLISEIQTKDLPTRNVAAIVTWMVMELDKLSNGHLVRVCDLCVTHVSSSTSASKSCWKDLMPKILNLLISKNCIEHYGSEITGEEYKKQVIVSLCQAKWDVGILTPIASMFIYIPLNLEEHQQVVSKLCCRLEDLQPDEVPPLVHQVLLLTKSHHSMTLFFALKKYYNKLIYKYDDSSAMLDSTKLESADLIELVAKKEVIENESMVLYHIEDCAKRSFGCITELVRTAKASQNSPELFIDPFMIAVLLIISNVPSYEVQVHDVIRNTIVRVIDEEEKQLESDWLRKVLGTHCNVEQVLTKLIQSKVCEQEGVLQGLVGLSKALLRANAGLGKAREKVASRVWRYGRMIIVNIVRKHKHVAGFILSTITDTIFNRPEVTQYTDCLAELCETSPLLVVEKPNVIARLLEALPGLPDKTAHKVTAALISLTRISNKARDNLILILRKSLFIHDVGTRKMAVVGFLQLLKRLKIRGMQSLSQNSFQMYSCPSIFTQTCIDVHQQPNNSSSISGNNEGICLEVLGVLKRCFILQVPVKICLYNGLNQALSQNTELCIPVAGMLLERLGEFFESDLEVLPPLNFSKAVIIKNAEIEVQEPLGHLVFAVGQVSVTGKRIIACSEDYDPSNKHNKLESFLDSLILRFSECQLKHLNLEGEIEATVEGRYKEECLKLCISVYQALMAYIISIWDASSTSELPESLLALYRAYSNLCDFAENCKSAKKEKGPKRKANTSSQPATQSSVKKSTPFVLPKSVFNFETCYRFLELLICDSVSWSTDEVAGVVRNKKPLHRFAMQTCLDVILKAKEQLAEYKGKTVFKKASELAGLLYERCLCRFNDCMEFDSHSAVLGVECFTEILSLVVTYFKKQLPDFLEEVCEVTISSGLNDQLEKLIKFYLKTLGKVLDIDEDEEDEDTKKLVDILITGVNIVSLQLPVTESCIVKVLRWLTDLAQQKVIRSMNNAKTLVSLLLTLQLRAKSDTVLHDNLALQLCHLFGSINEVEVEESPLKHQIITDENKEIMLPLLCSTLSSRLDSVDWVVVRLKAELPLINQADAYISSPKTRRHILKKKEKEVVQELVVIVSSIEWICTSAVPAGPCPETICRLLYHTYSTLTAFTKYFLMRSSNQNPAYQEARFSKLVKLSGSNLSSQVADFLLYIETVDVEDTNTRKVSAKLLRQAKKQTVYIPKLVAELENFTKCVTQLSVKCKDPSLTTNVKLTTTRDFRLNTKRLEEVLKRNHESESEDEDEETENRGTNEETSVSEESNKKSSSQRSTVSQESSTAAKKKPRKKRKT